MYQRASKSKMTLRSMSDCEPCSPHQVESKGVDSYPNGDGLAYFGLAGPRGVPASSKAYSQGRRGLCLPARASGLHAALVGLLNPNPPYRPPAGWLCSSLLNTSPTGLPAAHCTVAVVPGWWVTLSYSLTSNKRIAAGGGVFFKDPNNITFKLPTYGTRKLNTNDPFASVSGCGQGQGMQRLGFGGLAGF